MHSSADSLLDYISQMLRYSFSRTALQNQTEICYSLDNTWTEILPNCAKENNYLYCLLLEYRAFYIYLLNNELNMYAAGQVQV